MDLRGASAVVTGGASGLGAAAVLALASAGARVVVADLERARDRSSEVAGDTMFVPCDVTAEKDVANAVQAAETLGPLRLALACAGVPDEQRLVGSRGPRAMSGVRRVHEVNYLGTVSLLGHAAHTMRRNEPAEGDRGVVVMVGSTAGLDGVSIAYGGSKAAVAGITLAAARELAGDAIRVVTIAPGLFSTPMAAGMSERAREPFGEFVHPARPGLPEQFALLVRHIVANPMLNGEVIRLDGAVRARLST